MAPTTLRAPSPRPAGRARLLGMALGCALLGAACSGGSPWGATPQNWPQVKLPTPEQAGAYVDAGTTAGSQRLAARVRAALAAQPALAGVQVEGLEGGLVVLSGAVPSAADKPLAVQTARQVLGVREVVDRTTSP